MKKLVKNCIECACEKKEIICSASRHDYKSCSCGKVSVDGGLDYAKRSGEGYKEMAEWEDVSGVPESDELPDINNAAGKEVLKYLEEIVKGVHNPKNKKQ